ncbi:Mariner Mos1 transposase [Eumeta japonica]|uniref:Mariner Mos1 transposase n=1 Tax=Eumeta variegata TaxID=151549 RepID=A0A4C1W5M5_EUMVA|nr:Mariner Mos1 transposase [Eumeta japonica]
MSSLLLFGLGSGLSGRRWRLRLPVRILSVQRNKYWNSIPNTIDDIEPSAEGKTPSILLQTRQIIILHDNARPHVEVPVKNYLKTLDWELLPHTPYSPDIAPSDYHLFRSMAHALSEQRFTSYEDTKNWVDSWIASKDKEFFRLRIRTLPERWKKVVASDGQYFD